MSKRAEGFMDQWLDAKVTDRHLKAPDKSAPILAKKNVRATPRKPAFRSRSLKRSLST